VALARGVRALCEVILDTHERTAEAIHRADRLMLRRALLTDPLTSSIGDADALMADLFQLERDALPADWFADPGRSA
jgi:alpha-galactosidase